MSADTTLRAVFAEYTRYRLRGARENSRRKFQYALDHWAEYLGREPVLSDLTDESILDALWHMAETIKPATVNGYGAKLAALWRFAARKGMVQVWPDFQRLPTDENVPVAFSREEIRAVFHVIDNATGSVGDVPASLWWGSLGHVLWDTGERISATLSAQWCDLRGEHLTIRAEHRKGKMGSRRSVCYRLHPDTVGRLEQIRQPKRDLIFPWPKNPSMLYYDFKKILRESGVKADRAHMFHCFRRSVASYAQDGGMDASVLLGHSDRRVTENSYLSPSIVHRPAACDVLFRPGS